MTTNTENIINQVKQATNFQINKRALQEKIKIDLHLAYNGGLFLVDQTLLAFLSTWPTDELFVEDVYGNPIKCLRTELLQQAQECYQTAMNSWHIQHEELRRVRKI